MSPIRHRLDALEAYPSWFFIRLLLLTGFNWAVNAAESVLFVLARRPMAKSIYMATYAVEALGGGVILGAAVGGPLFGHLADTRGRRWALLLAKTISLIGMVLSVLARKDYELITARILAGIGLGGELPVATSLMHELTPRSLRGCMLALLEAFTGVGGVVGVMLGFVLAPNFGWRIAYLAICGGVFCGGMLCFLLPESPRWLATVGRVDEAVAVMEKLERAHGTRLVHDSVMAHKSTPAVQTDESAAPKETAKSSVLDQPIQVLELWALWTAMDLSSYALGVYIPVLIGLSGFNMLSGWNTMMLLRLSQVLGSVLTSLVIEEFELKRVLACVTTSAAVVAILLSHSPWYSPIVILGTCTVSALLAASWSCVLVYTPMNSATETRGRVVGYAFGFSRLATIGGSWLYPLMFNVWKVSVSAMVWGFSGLLVAIVLVAVHPYEHLVRLKARHTKMKTKTEDDEELPLVVNHSPKHEARKNE